MQTILATFNDNTNAKEAIESLLEQGFDRSSIHLQSAEENASPSPAKPSMMDPFGFAGVFSALLGGGAKSEAGKYAEAVRRGNSVVVLDAEDEQLEEAVSLMQELGAVDIDESAARWKSKGWTGFDANAKPLSSEELASEREDSVMPVVQEELKVGKRSVQGGGVRVVKRTTETPVSELVTLREEHASFVRRPVDRAATESDFENFKEGVVEVLEMSEEPVIEKSARVVEEVVVRKDVTERNQKVSDTVRRTDVDVERVPAKATAAETKPSKKHKS